MGVERRAEILNRYQQALKDQKQKLGEVISAETGKPMWESLSEVDAMIGKVPISIEAQRKFRSEETRPLADARGITRFKPHGVAAVLGPFNMPGHLPNGHIVPALLAGNTVVFKPSEYTPRVGDAIAEHLREAGLPQGVLHVVHGAKEMGAALATHSTIDAIYFTGSVAAGVAINKANADRPGVILALEMGGNNPLVVWDVEDTRAAALMVVQSAFITSGQRCSCARRLIVPHDADGFIDLLIAMTRGIRVGNYQDRPEPFMGPVISDEAGAKLLSAQADLIARGGEVLLEMKPMERTAMLSPGIIDVSSKGRSDEEIFGPLLQVIRVQDFDEAIRVANYTRFGLVAGILSDRRELYERFYTHTGAGVIHWNRPTTGASSQLPFGGVGLSGNHRPAGYWSAGYCSYPVAVMESEKVTMPAAGKMPPGIDMS
jgi:succinylglutamic semialdehyde dehydrogenase